MKLCLCLSSYLHIYISHQFWSFHSSTHGIFLFLPLGFLFFFLTAKMYFLHTTFQASHDVKALLFWKGLIFWKLQFWVYQHEIRLHLFSLKSSRVASARGTSFSKKWPNINCSISLTCQPCASDYDCGCLATGLIFTKHTMYRNLVSVLL